MFSFIFHHLASLKVRSFSIVFITMILCFLLTLFVLIYRNTLSVIEYYTPASIDPRRVTISVETNLFDLFSKNSGGISALMVSKIQQDALFSRTRVFSFIDANILGKFDIFTFRFDMDVPVFGLDDSLGELSGFGISPSMIHYYNLELAGSHPMFPTLDADFLRGKRVSLIF